MARNHVSLMISALFAVLLLAFGSGANAGLNGSPNHIAATLEAEHPAVTPGTPSSIAIRMVPDAGWHGYWLNGGDAGFGMQVEWHLPKGVGIGPLAYPVPDTLVISGLMNHVYERPYALVAPLTIAADVAPGTRLPITGTARWLACTNEICVPEQAELTAEIVAADPGSVAAAAPQFDAWRAAIPQGLNGPARFELANGKLRLAIPLPRTLSLSDAHLFVEEPRINQPAAAQAISRRGDWVIVETAAGTDADTAKPFHALIRIGKERGLSFIAQPGAVGAAGVPLESEVAPAASASLPLFATALLGAIIGGLILNIMPCVFPILSLKALALARAGGDQSHARAEGLAYTAGAVLTCLALGTLLLLLRAGGEAVGWAFQLQSPASVLMLALLMAAITANLAGLFEFGTLSLRFGRAGGAPTGQADAPSGPAKQAFLTGALAAFVATPCSGPFLGAALGATLVLPIWAALPIFGGLGLGLALPFLALALFPALRRRLPAPGAWMETLRRWLALPMALTALALVWLLGRQVGPVGWLVGGAAVALMLALGWWAGRLQRAGKEARIAFFAMAASLVPLAMLLPQVAHAPGAAGETSSVIGARTWSAEALATARSRGPVFVYFTADWCVSCKVNEASSIERAETAEAFRAAGVTALIADWTNADPAITHELARHGRNSVPLYLWYPAGGGEPEVLPQILTPAMLGDRARAATGR